MEKSLQDIIEILERADGMFKDLPEGPRYAGVLWERGLDQLTKALWVYEKGIDIDEEPEA